MTRRARLLAVAAVLALSAAGCGDAGNDEEPEAPDVTEQVEGGSEGTGAAGGGDGTEEIGVGGAPDLDPSSMPPPGQVVLEVDGETFTIDAADMDYFICDLADETFVNVRSESATQDVTVQANLRDGSGGANITPGGSELRYNSFFQPTTPGGATVEAPYYVYEAPFNAVAVDDPGVIEQVGVGRVSVTCPS